MSRLSDWPSFWSSFRQLPPAQKTGFLIATLQLWGKCKMSSFFLKDSDPSPIKIRSETLQNNNFKEMTQFMQKHEKMLGNLARALSELPTFSQL